MPVEPPRPQNKQPGAQCYDREAVDACWWRSDYVRNVRYSDKRNKGPKAITSDAVVCARGAQVDSP
jgi:flavin-dependent dehydrogenase